MFCEFYRPIPFHADRILFLDRDNTLVKDSGYFHDSENVEFLDDSYAFLNADSLGNTMVAIVSNQSGIGRGLFSIEDSIKVNRKIRDRLAQDGGMLHAATFCPHQPLDDCLCRKPGTLMFEYLMKIANVMPGSCLHVGDSNSDEDAARALGIPFVRATQCGIRKAINGWVSS